MLDQEVVRNIAKSIFLPLHTFNRDHIWHLHNQNDGDGNFFSIVVTCPSLSLVTQPWRNRQRHSELTQVGAISVAVTWLTSRALSIITIITIIIVIIDVIIITKGYTIEVIVAVFCWEGCDDRFEGHQRDFIFDHMGGIRMRNKISHDIWIKTDTTR